MSRLGSLESILGILLALVQGVLHLFSKLLQLLSFVELGALSESLLVDVGDSILVLVNGVQLAVNIDVTDVGPGLGSLKKLFLDVGNSLLVVSVGLSTKTIDLSSESTDEGKTLLVHGDLGLQSSHLGLVLLLDLLNRLLLMLSNLSLWSHFKTFFG